MPYEITTFLFAKAKALNNMTSIATRIQSLVKMMTIVVKFIAIHRSISNRDIDFIHRTLLRAREREGEKERVRGSQETISTKVEPNLEIGKLLTVNGN